ncbi:MAG: hypothetical protein KAR40_16275 [Candidatus Sabulitectum sp.]|nr:hypothetical protein [Candidatus Sabulitectum sp.]
MKPRSHTLFHFTKNIDALKSILKNGFWPHYSLEDFNWYNSEMGFIGYPMVCFCDIPLTRIEEHVGFYGEYGLGLTKQWGVSNDLCPLIYLTQSSPVTAALYRLCTNDVKAIDGYYIGSKVDLKSIISYIKPIEGNILVGAIPTPKEFYQENEWRYVPRDQAIRQWINKEEYANSTTLSQLNEIAKDNGGLQITPNDIKYIFVKSDANIPGIINFIQTELDHFSANDLKILMSRVVSSESINLDL